MTVSARLANMKRMPVLVVRSHNSWQLRTMILTITLDSVGCNSNEASKDDSTTSGNGTSEQGSGRLALCDGGKIVGIGVLATEMADDDLKWKP